MPLCLASRLLSNEPLRKRRMFWARAACSSLVYLRAHARAPTEGGDSQRKTNGAAAMITLDLAMSVRYTERMQKGIIGRRKPSNTDAQQPIPRTAEYAILFIRMAISIRPSTEQQTSHTATTAVPEASTCSLDPCLVSASNCDQAHGLNTSMRGFSGYCSPQRAERKVL